MDLQPQQPFMDDRFSYRERHTHRHDVLERLIDIAESGLVSLLAFRFGLSLLGANPANGFAHFVYGFTTPFTAPFFNLFSYDHASLGIANFEGYTLVAIAFYVLLGVGLKRLLTVTRY